MYDNKTILKLHFEGVSARQIAVRTKKSRNTVADVIKAFDSSGQCPDKIDQLSEDELEKILYPDKEAIPVYVQPDYSYCHKELLRPGVTLSTLYDEYVFQCKSEHKPFYKRSYFFEKYSDYVKKNNLTMHINHKPGDKVMVDWDGKTMAITDQCTGETYTVYLFVGTLPFSMYSYVQGCLDTKTPNWIDCHINMFNYFGGVPRLLIPDNLRTGVISNKKYEDPVLNKTYQEMADYYGTTIIPTRVKKPKDKAAVEGSVGNATNAIIGRLRNQQFFSLSDLNKAIRKELETFNTNHFQKRDGSRYSVFNDEEKDFLYPLPNNPYELSTYKVATVSINYHIQADKMNYSVPYEYVGKKVDVKISKSNIDVYYKGTLIASHKRLYGRRNQYSTNDCHMPKNHQLFKWNKERFINWGKSIGNNTETLISNYINRYKTEEQSYKGCISILKLSDKYTALRLEKACTLALEHISNPTYKNIKLILESGQDQVETSKKETINDTSNDNAIVRGSDYYRRKR